MIYTFSLFYCEHMVQAIKIESFRFTFALHRVFVRKACSPSAQQGFSTTRIQYPNYMRCDTLGYYCSISIRNERIFSTNCITIAIELIDSDCSARYPNKTASFNCHEIDVLAELETHRYNVICVGECIISTLLLLL